MGFRSKLLLFVAAGLLWAAPGAVSAADLNATLAKLDAATLTRITEGTRQHAVRRGHEMAAAAQMLADLGVAPVMATASEQLHERLAAE